MLEVFYVTFHNFHCFASTFTWTYLHCKMDTKFNSLPEVRHVGRHVEHVINATMAPNMVASLATGSRRPPAPVESGHNWITVVNLQSRWRCFCIICHERTIYFNVIWREFDKPSLPREKYA